MAIRRDDVDQGKVDFSDIATRSRLPPIHPGEILRDEFLVPMDMSVYKLAKALKVSRPRLNEVVLGKRAVTTDTAFVWAAISERRQSFGLPCKPAMTSTLLC